MSLPFIILGSGGHAKVLMQMVNKKDNLLGYVSPEPNDFFNLKGINYLGKDEEILCHNPNEVELLNGLGSLPEYNLRWELENFLPERDYVFKTVIHPQTIIADDLMTDEGVQIMAGCIIQPGVKIKRGTIINTGAKIDHDCSIGRSCHIAPGVTLSGGVKIGDYVHVGTGANVIQAISISDKAVISAGTTVKKDFKC